jgi:hypothetical protein
MFRNNSKKKKKPNCIHECIKADFTLGIHSTVWSRILPSSLLSYKCVYVYIYIYIYTECLIRYRTRHFFNNFTTNEDIGTKCDADLPHCVRNVKEKNVLLFKFCCNIFICVRIIKEMLGSVASGTPCIYIYIYINCYLPVLNWSLILRMRYRPRVFDNKMMGKML